MTSFTFSAEQVKSAPPEVRRWIENEIVKAFGTRPNADITPSEMQIGPLAICTAEEAAEIFNLISGNFPVTQVFFELTRETPFTRSAAPLHSLNLSDMLRHVQFAHSNQLFECFNIINQALQKIRHDPGASLFAFDEVGHVYVHETTCQSIRQLWHQLVPAHVSAAKDEVSEAASGPAPAAFDEHRTFMRPERVFAETPTATETSAS